MIGEVLDTTWLTPALIRVALRVAPDAGFAMPDATDAYINAAFPPSGAPYDAVFDPRQVKADHPREVQPLRRRYTVRSWDQSTGRLDVDVVVHGDSGVGGPWAAAARPGDVLVFEGPGGGYRPDPEAGWHLLVGDESALPAIAASLEQIADGVPVVVRLVCDGPEHEIELARPDGLDLRWLHRTGAPDDADLLLASLQELTFPAGDVHAFVHGEADEIRAIRRHLLSDRGLSRTRLSCSPYWRRDMDDEAWRAIKRDYVAQMEAETAQTV